MSAPPQATAARLYRLGGGEGLSTALSAQGYLHLRLLSYATGVSGGSPVALARFEAGVDRGSDPALVWIDLPLPASPGRGAGAAPLLYRRELGGLPNERVTGLALTLYATTGGPEVATRLRAVADLVPTTDPTARSGARVLAERLVAEGALRPLIAFRQSVTQTPLAPGIHLLVPDDTPQTLLTGLRWDPRTASLRSEDGRPVSGLAHVVFELSVADRRHDWDRLADIAAAWEAVIGAEASADTPDGEVEFDCALVQLARVVRVCSGLSSSEAARLSEAVDAAFGADVATDRARVRAAQRAGGLAGLLAGATLLPRSIDAPSPPAPGTADPLFGAAEPKFEALHGGTTLALAAYTAVLTQAARAVCAIQKRGTSGQHVGTGFLVSGGALSPRLAAHPVCLVTNFHVMADSAGTGRVMAPDAEMVFSGLSAAPVPDMDLALLWRSPFRAHDCTVWSVGRPPAGAEPFTKIGQVPPHCCRPYEEGPVGEIAVIGHPQGRGLEISQIQLDWMQAREETYPDQTQGAVPVLGLLYMSPTEVGSSGSPVFNRADMSLIGLHSGTLADRVQPPPEEAQREASALQRRFSVRARLAHRRDRRAADAAASAQPVNYGIALQSIRAAIELFPGGVG